MDDTAAHDTAAFRFDSLPGVTLVATRYLTPRTTPDGHDLPVGFIEIDAHRDTPDPSHSGGHPGPTAPPSQDRPFVPGGKVPFMFRSLPGVTFYASRGGQWDGFASRTTATATTKSTSTPHSPGLNRNPEVL